jgi:molecular chaperone DnaK (HSP70)
LLEKKIGHLPHSEIDPDLCVAVGAGMQAAREMGMDHSGVLIDVTPYTFGTSAVGEIDGVPTMNMAVPLIRRNTKLPARKSEVFFTMYEEQEAVEVKVCQGEAPNAMDNILLGNYLFQLTPAPENSEIILHFDLDVNGILKVRAVEKASGKEISAVIENAMSRFSDADLADTRNRINDLWSDTGGEDEDMDGIDEDSTEYLPAKYASVIDRAEEKLAQASEDDREEMIGLIEDIHDAAAEGRWEDADAAIAALDDILFYIG